MESGPAVFAGMTFVLFGLGLLLWAGARLRLRAPVAYGVSPATSALLSFLSGGVSVALGVWCLGQV
ncbi:hypothetical protein [Streptomyces sp. H27-D2]|uniref:hypothetical protein n=1 Tax=Streptomyces sp. H27-D2 TaxID=3046304 RepID=UPI002DB7AFBC|nr:hypothetical protein [Streptomyces sp. H27-D2]MEC4015012.1 hypothetical protein [Streptomyces sp. H27-D2]